MKILAVLGSARRNGNTEMLIKEALRGMGEGHDVTLRVLSEMNIFGCQGCRGCRLKDAEGCIFQDEMQTLYTDMKAADAIVLGSPIFYGEVTGQMKSFMDRWYALRDHDKKLRLSPGKRALFIVVQGADDPHRYGRTVERLEKVLKSYEMVPRILVAAGLEKKNEAAGNPAIMENAFKAGTELISP